MTIYQICDVTVDTDSASIKKNNAEIILLGNAYDLLICLIQAAPKILSNDEIMASVWSNRVVNPDNIKQNIIRIRKILGDDSKSPKYIESVRGKGYRCSNKVRVFSKPIINNKHLIAEHRKFKVAGVMALLSFILLLVSVYFSVSKLMNKEPLRIAVMPFTTLNTSQSDVHKIEGLSDELIHSLVQKSELNVLSQTTIMDYKNTGKSTSDISEKFELDVLVEGIFQRRGERIQVYIYLIDANSHTHYWSMEFNCSPEELFSIRPQVSSRIINTLLVKIRER